MGLYDIQGQTGNVQMAYNTPYIPPCIMYSIKQFVYYELCQNKWQQASSKISGSWIHCDKSILN